ncbi:MAG: cyclopropane fatty acyl phospholipid synthase [Candidatus Saccharibacteria bacterium]|nr:cyclopropane fatty acyl phospholipid synthase [Candidatus Saccharibacteria bacterium]
MNMFERKVEILLKKAGIQINGSNAWDVRINDSSIYRDVFVKGSLGLGDGYSAGKWDVEQIDVFFEKVLQTDITHSLNLLDIVQALRNTIVNTQAGRRAFQVGHKHYDLGNDMYSLMLGESMGYSNGMYLNASDNLTKAQYNKFDALCKKLKLKPGMKVLEIGAGWGTFARHAAKNYGVEVVGLTVSKEQKKFAEERCKGLPAKFLLVDYRELDDKYTHYFDRVVSIEMVEAVGKKNLKKYFMTVENALNSKGLFGMQAIVGTGKDDAFLSTRIFPNGHVPSIESLTKATAGLLRVKQWESFGTDYDKTLLAWDSNFKKNWSKISKLANDHGELLYDEQFYRMWRYYLLCCAATFRVGRNDVAQIVMSKCNSLSGLK